MKIWTQKWISAIAALMLLATTLAVLVAPTTAGAATTGYWVLDGSGTVTPVAGAPHYGNHSGAAVAIAATPSGKGYYIVDGAGVVSVHGDAEWKGDLTGVGLAQPVVAIAVNSTGYVLVGRDGGVFAFPGSLFHGSVPGSMAARGSSPIVDVLLKSDGSGYLVIADDGGVFAFGTSLFLGSIPGVLPVGVSLDRPVVAASMSTSGGGYVLAGGDGGVFNFGQINFRGSLSTSGLSYVAILALGKSYALLASNGQITDLSGFNVKTSVSALGVVNAVDFAAVSVSGTTTLGTEAATSTTTKASSTTAATSTTKKPVTTTSTTKKPATTTTKKPAPTTTQAQPTGGAGKQFTVYDMTGVVQDFDTYADANFVWPSSGSMRSPTNYADGRAYVRLQVVSKPTSIPMVAQLCFWFQYTPGKFETYEETCSPKSKITIKNEGVFYADLGAPSSWWSQNGPKNRTGVFDWGKKPHVGRIFLKDDVTGTLFIEQKCGSACWSGGDAAVHTPVKMNVELIFVERGKSFTPPADWKNNPWG